LLTRIRGKDRIEFEFIFMVAVTALPEALCLIFLCFKLPVFLKNLTDAAETMYKI